MKMLLVGIVKPAIFKSLIARTRLRPIPAKNAQILPIQKDKKNLKVFKLLSNVMNALLVLM